MESAFSTELTVSASEFKTKCLELMDRLERRKLTKVTVTKRGKPHAVMTPPDVQIPDDQIFGRMKGTVIAPPGFDFTASPWDEDVMALIDEGVLHR